MKCVFQKNNKRGFTILFAVLVSTLILALGISIVNITLKEVTLSSVGRDSQVAFYMADTGIECAFYWDLFGVDMFATSTDSIKPTTPLKCLEKDWFNEPGILGQPDLIYSVPEKYPTSAKTVFYMQSPEGYCAKVQVSKEVVSSASGPYTKTTIDSRGYNTCKVNDPRRIERGYEMEY